MSEPAAMPLVEQASPLSGEIWGHSRDQQGCRLVQQALREADSNKKRIALAVELRTHVSEALQCPYANHVLQACIDTLCPADAQFIIDEIRGTAVEAAQHRYGCRVLQRLLEHCSSVQVQGLVEELLHEAVALSTHIYGNYVMQHLLEHVAESRWKLMQILVGQLPTVSAHDYGCAVLTKALDLHMPLANALLCKPHNLAAIGCSRHGHLTVKLALQKAEAQERREALLVLAGQKEKLARDRYGRILNKYLEQCWDQKWSGEEH